MSIPGANGANWGNGGFGAMSVIEVLARCLPVRVVPNVYGCPRVEPETPRATGVFGMWCAIGHMPPQRRSTNTAGVLAVKKVFGTPHGGWVLQRPVLRTSKPGRACLPCLRWRYLS